MIAPMRSILYMDGRDLECDCEAFMRLRLTYAGSLPSSKAPDDSDADWIDKKAARKHDIRRRFHAQLKAFWGENKFLSEFRGAPCNMRLLLPEGAIQDHWPDPNKASGDMPLSEILATANTTTYKSGTYRWVPLIWKQNSVTCSIRVLCLRRDHMNSVSPERDIDNRMKTLVDALAKPTSTQGSPLSLDGKALGPQAGEDPFFVLMDSDKQITHLEVETDYLLEAAPPGEDESFVRLVVSVEIRPYNVNTFNISWA